MRVDVFGTSMDITLASITGQRSENQDSAGWLAMTKKGIFGMDVDGNSIRESVVTTDEIVFCIVCDGMGGLDNGKAVSSRVVSDSLEWVKINIFDTPMDLFIKYRDHLCELESVLMSDYPRSGTTVAILFGFHSLWFSMHIGDSRIYTLNGQDSFRTRDHSPVEELYRSGIIEEADMNDHPMKNIISSYIGGGYASELVFDELGHFEKAVVCSDGAFSYMGIDEFKNLMTTSDDAEQIVSRSLELGSKDNISVIECSLSHY